MNIKLRVVGIAVKVEAMPTYDLSKREDVDNKQ